MDVLRLYVSVSDQRNSHIKEQFSNIKVEETWFLPKACEICGEQNVDF